MNLQIISDKEVWDNFVLAHGPLSGGFLHSWAWGEGLKTRGKRIYRMGIFDDSVTPPHPFIPRPLGTKVVRGGSLIAIALLIENRLPLGLKYLYIPRGPITVGGETAYIQVLGAVANFSKKEGAMFLRFEPAELAKDFTTAPPGALPARHLQPENTLLLDLEKTEEELRAAMHEKTRYNIGLAERKGIVVKESDAENLPDFMRLLDETIRRDKIKMYGRGYFESILKSIDKNFNAKIWTAYYYPPLPACNPSERGMQGRGGVGVPVAAAFNIYFGGTATYLFGASSDEYRNLMAPHLLQWKMILDAKTRGYKYYDFWGINPRDEKSPNYYPRWEGFSRFKRGFVEKEGTSVELLYADCLELPISRFWYKLFKVIKKLI